MEQLAPPGTVRLTGETGRLAEGYVEVRSLAPIPVKGLSDPIEIFELTGAGTATSVAGACAVPLAGGEGVSARDSQFGCPAVSRRWTSSSRPARESRQQRW